ncbi:PREDICTED: rRNA methyltransferase 1, mitochondrial-like [Priapulus caudatus]|uniref:rRNA methyltransferase 1, mitochondrial n=1 Tax=Priapulus caudatus TaxID=37621 RepID=A0ABM1F9X3_PRICU|nr:PREDICTED: rRNA methyltransferase 1, mitochondrial-like [Priapulus caudatus]
MQKQASNIFCNLWLCRLRGHFSSLRQKTPMIPNIANARLLSSNRKKPFEQNRSEDGDTNEQYISGDLLAMENSRTVRKRKREYAYNYGLPGLGKEKVKKAKPSKIQITGEILFGISPILLALQQKRRKIFQLYVKKNILTTNEKVRNIAQTAENMCVQVSEVGRTDLDELSCFRLHQGVCMDVGMLAYHPLHVRPPHYNPDGSPVLWLLLNQVQDPMNFGSILRSSYFLGVDTVITTRGSSCPMSPVVSKSSAGALEVMPVYEVASGINFLTACKELNWQLLSTRCGSSDNDCLEDSRSCPENPTLCSLESFVLNRPSVLIIGNEGTGVSTAMSKLCDYHIAITPRRSLVANIDSMNVSVATGILLYSLLQGKKTSEKVCTEMLSFTKAK